MRPSSFRYYLGCGFRREPAFFLLLFGLLLNRRAPVVRAGALLRKFLLCRAVMGLFAGFTPMVMALATVSAPREKVSAAIGLVQSAQLLSVAVGPAIGGYVASHFGIRYAFFATAGLCALALLAAS